MMRFVDMMYAIPYLLIAILLVTILGREFYLVVLAITAFSWMDMARVVRGQTLSLRSWSSSEAARAIGVPTRGIDNGGGWLAATFDDEYVLLIPFLIRNDLEYVDYSNWNFSQ